MYSYRECGSVQVGGCVEDSRELGKLGKLGGQRCVDQLDSGGVLRYVGVTMSYTKGSQVLTKSSVNLVSMEGYLCRRL